jgi:hypothetical protein
MRENLRVLRENLLHKILPLVINDERARAVNFSIPVSLEPYALMYQRPQEESRALLFIYPFQPLVRL